MGKLIFLIYILEVRWMEYVFEEVYKLSYFNNVRKYFNNIENNLFLVNKCIYSSIRTKDQLILFCLWIKHMTTLI